MVKRVLFSIVVLVAVARPVLLFAGIVLPQYENEGVLPGNPAGSATLSSPVVDMVGALPYNQTSVYQVSLGVGVPFGRQVLACNFERVTMSGAYFEDMVACGSSFAIGIVAVGGAVKFLGAGAPGYREDDPAYAGPEYVVSYDLGVRISPATFITFGFAGLNLNSPAVHLLSGGAGITHSADLLGEIYCHPFPPVVLSAAVRTMNGRWHDLVKNSSLLSEVWFQDILSLRMGVHYGLLVGGIGFRANMLTFGFDFGIHKALGITYMSSLTVHL